MRISPHSLFQALKASHLDYCNQVFLVFRLVGRFIREFNVVAFTVVDFVYVAGADVTDGHTPFGSETVAVRF